MAFKTLVSTKISQKDLNEQRKEKELETAKLLQEAVSLLVMPKKDDFVAPTKSYNKKTANNSSNSEVSYISDSKEKRDERQEELRNFFGNLNKIYKYKTLDDTKENKQNIRDSYVASITNLENIFGDVEIDFFRKKNEKKYKKGETGPNFRGKDKYYKAVALGFFKLGKKLGENKKTAASKHMFYNSMRFFNKSKFIIAENIKHESIYDNWETYTLGDTIKNLKRDYGDDQDKKEKQIENDFLNEKRPGIGANKLHITRDINKEVLYNTCGRRALVDIVKFQEEDREKVIKSGLFEKTTYKRTTQDFLNTA
jgi:hypothetical protein